ncbi:MAG: hypothetical protein GX318_00135 [Clostridia bacterium]|nr:hypothetical protein [Clostridia bacterium]
MSSPPFLYVELIIAAGGQYIKKRPGEGAMGGGALVGGWGVMGCAG